MQVSITNSLKIGLFRAQNLKYLSTTTHLNSVNSESSAYDGLGKTTVRVINNEDTHLNIVNTYSTNGFRLSNNLFITGSIILFPTHVFSWSVKRGSDITPESLRIFDLIVPKVKIVVIGYGHEEETYDASLPQHLKKRGVSCELLPTPKALTTYNFLLSDAVHVAGAFVTYNRPVISSSADHERLFVLPDILEDTTSRIVPGHKDTKEYYEPMIKTITKETEDDIKR